MQSVSNRTATVAASGSEPDLRSVTSTHLLNGHDHLDDIQTVQTKVGSQVGGGGDVLGVIDLVKRLQKSHDSLLNHVLGQHVGRGVVSDERHGGGSHELGSGDGGHERSRQSGPGNGGSRKTENGLSEHFPEMCSVEDGVDILPSFYWLGA